MADEFNTDAIFAAAERRRKAMEGTPTVSDPFGDLAGMDKSYLARALAGTPEAKGMVSYKKSAVPSAAPQVNPAAMQPRMATLGGTTTVQRIIGPQALPGFEKKLGALVENQKMAMENAANAQRDLMEEQARIRRKTMVSQAAEDAKLLKRQDAIQDQKDALLKDKAKLDAKLEKAKVDPGRIWKGSDGTARAVASVIGTILSGIGDVFMIKAGRKAQFLDKSLRMVNLAIDRDIQLQENAIKKLRGDQAAKTNALGLLAREMGSLDAARNRLRLHKMQDMKMALAEAGDRAQNDILKAKIWEAATALDQKILQEKNQRYMARQGRKVITSTTRRGLVRPAGAQPGKPIPRQDARKLDAKASILKDIARLQKAHEATEGAGGTLGALAGVGKAGAKFDSLRKFISRKIAKAYNSGALSDQDVETFNKAIPGATTRVSVAKQVFKEIQSVTREQIGQSLRTLKRQGYDISPYADLGATKRLPLGAKRRD